MRAMCRKFATYNGWMKILFWRAEHKQITNLYTKLVIYYVKLRHFPLLKSPFSHGWTTHWRKWGLTIQTFHELPSVGCCHRFGYSVGEVVANAPGLATDEDLLWKQTNGGFFGSLAIHHGIIKCIKIYTYIYIIKLYIYTHTHIYLYGIAFI